ncbi:MAG: 16S rRNA (guanine(527)-N(7))-methyltransferase RsmG [Candidatus Izemoplasmatales bacterium]|nr:16S rRNA (guanine(527)-N(7))-methyltransferase RsmG [Candidatus Izemoplasmatales bacterium]
MVEKSKAFIKKDMIILLDMVKYFRGDIVDSWFNKQLETLNIMPSDTMMKQFALYHDFLIHKNTVMNLTAITEKEEIYKKHFLDSLYLILAFTPQEQTLLDVGSGAGFPSIPLKIMFPKLQITIIDALDKRIKFLTELVELLGLEGVTLIHGRIEDSLKKNHYEIVTARAVAKLNILTELCLPFVKPKGIFVAMKNANFQVELKEAQAGIALLGGTVMQKVIYSLDETTKHAMIVIQKNQPTDHKYPRAFNKIKKNPL